MATDELRQQNRGEVAQQISREMVALMRKVAGRGPTKARTTIARDYVLVMFQETLSAGERNLVQKGFSDEVRAVREGYQALLHDEAVQLIESVIGRKVIGFMSTNHFDPDLAAEIFVFDGEKSDQFVQEAEHDERSDDLKSVGNS